MYNISANSQTAHGIKVTDCYALTRSRNPACIHIPGYRPTSLMQGRLPNAKSSLHASMQSDFASVNTFKACMKIGIMGGTFDPIHNGHIHIALAAYKEYGMDKVWFMPAGDPYFKQGQSVSSPESRLEMTKLAVSAYPDCFDYSDMEIRSEGHTYSAETFSRLHEQYPEDEFYFIIGFDSLKSLASWYHPELLLKNAVILCALRDGGTIKEAERIREELESRYATVHPDIRFIHTPLIDISSTMIREKTKSGEDISGLVPDKVAQYIYIHKMY